MKIEATTAQVSNAPPFAHQSHVAEQGGLDRKHVEPGDLRLGSRRSSTSICSL